MPTTEIENHPFAPFAPPGASRLVLGSFPCPQAGKGGLDYGDWYYSGSGRNLFWPLLSALSKLPASTRPEKEALLLQNGLAITDICASIRRRRAGCADADLLVLAYQTEAIQAILDSHPIRQLVFTSRFVQRSFAREIAPHVCMPALPEAVLPSPSPAANRAIGADPHYKALKAAGLVTDVQAYRLLRYREILFPSTALGTTKEG